MKKIRYSDRNTITTVSNQEAPNYSIDISHYTIGEFVPKGKNKSTQVHLLLYAKNNPVPISVRFKSAATLGDLIVELDSARTRVFGMKRDKHGEDDED